ncbi:hypothetical protein S40293_04341 [Stachybotrys chartarum IBT 40293]|nr:hypothetical protein S40293_04341 [Stachybotrys chartarum IBT 40293]KFA79813.1 hypothetical protein S40288_00739 [Stachybotrys chartarum IBT 40288]
MQRVLFPILRVARGNGATSFPSTIKLRQPCQPLVRLQGLRSFSATRYLRDDDDEIARKTGRSREQHPPNSAERKADDRPWHRQNPDKEESEFPDLDPTGGDKTKGRLLTTPTRLLKLILPLPFHPKQEHVNETKEEKENASKETVDPLALLVHPQQPLSYLERLIQAELPPLRSNGKEKLPDIAFRAEADEHVAQAESKSSEEDDAGKNNVAEYSGLGHEGPDNEKAKWVRWSGSTEVGDFIRDAARGREFAVAIEGTDKEIRVAVPSFADRTYYMRMRLRRSSREIDQLAQVKRECDQYAHRSAHRLAQGGFAALAGWWGVVYYVTFHTEMGWDLVEPVTYLAGLTTIMGGYLWFLFISRDLSYKAAMNITVSRRQSALYQARGLDIHRWESLVQEANELRKEIRMIASEYDVQWNEMEDLGGKKVKKVLEKEKKKANGSNKKDDDESERDKGDESKHKDD